MVIYMLMGSALYGHALNLNRFSYRMLEFMPSAIVDGFSLPGVLSAGFMLWIHLDALGAWIFRNILYRL